MEIKLRDYQQECVDLLNNTPTGNHLVHLATGLGKTVIFTSLERHGRVLILSHRDELVNQPAKYYDGVCSFGVEKAEKHSDGEDVVSASVQSLCRKERLLRFDPDAFQTIIVDEAHHLSANNLSYTNIINYFSGAKRLLGFTATPKRSDGVRLTDYFDDIIYSKDLRWGIKNKYLCRVRAARIVADFTLTDVPLMSGDFSVGALGDKISNEVAMTAAKAYTDSCIVQDQHVLVYCPDVNSALRICSIFREVSPESPDTIQIITGKTPQEERTAILEGFKAGYVRCIVNCMVLTEGTDLPICNAIMNLRPTKSASLYQQIIGRGTRLYEGKDFLTIYDVLPDDVSSRRKIQTAPDLFGIAPEELAEKYIARINPEEDLMALCDELAGKYADLSSRMKFKLEYEEEFLEELFYLKEYGSSHSVQAAADYFEESASEKYESDIDFGNLRVKLNPYEGERYEFHPNMDSRITMSVPDVMGQVTLCLENCKGFDRYAYHTETLEEALRLIKGICMLGGDYQSYMWDKNVVEKWKHNAATERQVGWLRQNAYGYLANYEDLTKYGASSLIDAFAKAQDAKDVISKYSLEPDMKDKTVNKIKEAFRKEFMAPDVETDDEIYEARKEEVFEKVDAIERAQSSVLKHTDTGITYIAVHMPLKYVTLKEASPKQIDYANNLLTRLAAKQVFLDENIDVSKLNVVTSVLINTLLYIADKVKIQADCGLTVSSRDIYAASERIAAMLSDIASARNSNVVVQIGVRYFELYSPCAAETGTSSGPNEYKNVCVIGNIADSEKWSLYTYGGYNSNIPAFGCGVVAIPENGEDFSMYANGTPSPEENIWNVNGEICAAILGISEICKHGAKEITVYHDYEGIGKWASGSWRPKQECTKAYVQFIKEWKAAGVKLTFIHLKERSGDEWTAKAEKLAKFGAYEAARPPCSDSNNEERCSSEDKKE